MNITNSLNRRIQVFNYTEIYNELNEITYEYKYLKTIYSQVIPLSSKINDVNSDNEILESRYKFIVRKKSFKNINLNSILKFEEKDFKIEYFNVDYKNNEYIEIFVVLLKGE